MKFEKGVLKIKEKNGKKYIYAIVTLPTKNSMGENEESIELLEMPCKKQIEQETKTQTINEIMGTISNTLGREDLTPIYLKYLPTNHNSKTPNIIVRSMPDNTPIGVIHYSHCDQIYSYHPFTHVFVYYSESLLKSLYKTISTLSKLT